MSTILDIVAASTSAQLPDGAASSVVVNGWTRSITKLLRLWLRQFQLNQGEATHEASRYENYHFVLKIVQTITQALTVIESVTALAQVSTNGDAVFGIVIALLVTSFFGAVANGLATVFSPEERAKIARTMAAEHSILARRIDVQLQLDVAQRREATQVVYEILERYESLVNQHASVRLDKDLPNCAALRSWFEKRNDVVDDDLESNSSRQRRRNVAPSEWRVSPVTTTTADVIPENVVHVKDDDFLRQEARSQAIVRQLEYQMSRLEDHDS